MTTCTYRPPGKTILASVVVDAVQNIPDATLAFFYCKHADETRNSFISVARSILAQVLAQHPHLLPYFHEQASMSSDVSLSSTAVAKRMMQTSFSNCGRTYVIIDGLDECERGERKEISSWFQEAIEALIPADMGSIRCLIVGQDDGIARKDLGAFAIIKITNENYGDLKAFATEWHKKIEDKFGELSSKSCHIANIISVRAQGRSALYLIKQGENRSSSNVCRDVHLRGTTSKIF